MKQELMPKQHWAENTRGYTTRLPIVVTSNVLFDKHKLFRRYLSDVQGGKILEVGCAPGGWLAYFAQNFDLQAHGIEYVDQGAKLTHRNLSLLGLDAKIISGDFFTHPLPCSYYDIVFSCGFIEHFPETQGVINRLFSLVRVGGLIVTMVPNFIGLNGLIRKHFAPDSYAAHVKMNAKQLRDMHEAAGLKTFFCNYVGVPRLILPWDARAVDPYPATAAGKVIDVGKRVANRLCREFCSRVQWVPASSLLSPTILYIGKRQPGVS